MLRRMKLFACEVWVRTVVFTFSISLIRAAVGGPG